VKASYKKYESELPEYKGYTMNHDAKFKCGILIINQYILDVRKGFAGYYGGLHNSNCDWPPCAPLHHQQLPTPEYDDNPNICEGLKSKKESRFILEKSIAERVLQSTDIKNLLNFKKHDHPCPPNTVSIPVSATYNPSISPELYVFSFTTIVETFSKCLEKVREKLSSELWKTMEYCPLITIIDLLLLKHSDTDKHIEHLEEIIKGLIDDTKLLQTKINSLESQMSLFKSKLPVAVAVSEKTIAEVILCE
jgi:hypothetical protein